MAMKQLFTYPAYEDYYHIVGATKYRKTLFLDQNIRERLKEIIYEIVENKEKIRIVECSVAYNHIHVLIQTDVPISQVGQLLFGASSRKIREEYPVLVKLVEKGLWGGKSWEPIKDEQHLKNCCSYIKRHLPDNTKLDG